MRNLTGTLVAAALMMSSAAFADVDGWLNWRGPEGIGVSREKGLPEKLALGTPVHRWTIPIAGGGTPVGAGNKVYGFGYRGTGPDLQEVLFCANAETGKVLWEHGFNDFLSDITYDRYTIGSPTVDAETGNVYVLTSAGEFAAFTADGKPVFRIPMMEAFGRLTFTNGRTGAPTIEKDLVIVRGITSNWGADGPAMDRLYAFDKKTGEIVWSASPGKAPKDNTFGRPIFGWLNGKRVLYTGSGDGSLVCVNARNGQSIWRLPVSAGGMNATVVLHKGKVIGIHGDENLDSSEKLFLGGVNGVRAYPANEVGGASGYVAAFGLRQRLDHGFTLSGFVDWGRVNVCHNMLDVCLKNAASGAGGQELATQALHGQGLSLIWQTEPGLDFSVTWSRRRGQHPNSDANGLDSDQTRVINRMWLSATVRF